MTELTRKNSFSVDYFNQWSQVF